MVKKLDEQRQADLAFYTRKLSGLDFNLLVGRVFSRYQKIQNHDPLTEDALLEFIRGYAVIRDIMTARAISPEPFKKHHFSTDTMLKCQEMLDFFENNKYRVPHQQGFFKANFLSGLNRRELFEQFARLNPQGTNKKLENK